MKSRRYFEVYMLREEMISELERALPSVGLYYLALQTPRLAIQATRDQLRQVLSPAEAYDLLIWDQPFGSESGFYYQTRGIQFGIVSAWLPKLTENCLQCGGVAFTRDSDDADYPSSIEAGSQTYDLLRKHFVKHLRKPVYSKWGRLASTLYSNGAVEFVKKGGVLRDYCPNGIQMHLEPPEPPVSTS